MFSSCIFFVSLEGSISECCIEADLRKLTLENSFFCTFFFRDGHLEDLHTFPAWAFNFCTSPNSSFPDFGTFWHNSTKNQNFSNRFKIFTELNLLKIHRNQLFLLEIVTEFRRNYGKFKIADRY